MDINDFYPSTNESKPNSRGINFKQQVSE